MQKQVQDNNFRFRVKCRFSVRDSVYTREESEAGWYLVDQMGRFYTYGPVESPKPCLDEALLEIKIKIGSEWLTIAEIEARLK